MNCVDLLFKTIVIITVSSDFYGKKGIFRDNSKVRLGLGKMCFKEEGHSDTK